MISIEAPALANVYGRQWLNVFGCSGCLSSNHANNPRLGEFLRIFYDTVVVDMLFRAQTKVAIDVLQLDLKLRAMSTC